MKILRDIIKGYTAMKETKYGKKYIIYSYERNYIRKEEYIDITYKSFGFSIRPS
jgi:hypothetical protein